VAKSAAQRRSDNGELSVAVAQLSEEVRVLRQAVDELRDDVVWAARQVLGAGYEAAGQSPPRPVDPLAPDADYQEFRSPNHAETAEVLHCCAAPRLAWHGASEAPGIACEHCGYQIAEEGNILIWRDAATELQRTESGIAAMDPQGQQGILFE
jgi:hypothetical protein